MKGCHFARRDCGRLGYYSVKLGFINVERQPIEKLVFKIGLQNLASNKPIVDPDGEPLHAKLTAQGPFAQGSSYVVMDEWKAATWPVDKTLLASGNSCPRVDSIDVIYRNGTKMAVPPRDVDAYLVPQATIGIRCAYFLWYRGVPTAAPTHVQSPDRL